MAPISIRKLIVAAIITQLKTIKVINGYNTDLANNVVDWQLNTVTVASLPNVEVKDATESSEVKGLLTYNILSVEVVGRVGGVSLDGARNLLTDITEALKIKPAFPDSVYYFTLTEKPELTPEKLDKKAIKFDLSYEVKYRE